jgi:hypothetical protein
VAACIQAGKHFLGMFVPNLLIEDICVGGLYIGQFSLTLIRSSQAGVLVAQLTGHPPRSRCLRMV